jgi:lipid-A-disaccharide synthase
MTAEALLRVVLTAGEPSGDALGARLMRAMKGQHGGPIEFAGVGGPLMEAEGLRSLFPMHELALMGIAEILPSLRRILRRIRETADFILRYKPDILVTIDAPDFSFRVAKAVQVSRPPVMVHYVAPTVWAWRPKRAAKVARLYDGLICLLPFEPEYFVREGMSAAFTGHPAIENIRTLADGMDFRRRHGIPEDAFALGLLFGSRRGEVERIGEILAEATRQAIAQANSSTPIHLIVPTLPHLKAEVEQLLRNILPLPSSGGGVRGGGLSMASSEPMKVSPPHLSSPPESGRGGEVRIHLLTDPSEKWIAFAAMDAALAVSGTVALELALSGVPHVIAYRLKRLTYEIVRRRIRVQYAHLANILMDQPIVPEFIQDDCTPERIAPELASLFSINGAAATAQRTAFGRLQSRLAGNGNGEGEPSEQAARYVLGLYAHS